MKLNLVGNMLRICMVMSLLISAAWVLGQNTTSCAISGTVVDSTGAVVTGVAVTVTNQATGIATKVTSNNAGFFTAESLASGDYTINTKKDGFKSQVVKNIHLDPGQRRGADLKLDVGEANVTVTVEADAVVVQTESADLSGTVSEKQVANLMLNGRNFQSLAMIVPGVSSANGANQLANYGGGGYLGQTAIIVGGTSVEKTTYTIDGLYDMDPNGMINVNVLPTIDSISEFKILKDNYSAKYGLAGSGQILIVSKSGGAKYHGDAYEYVRNNYIGTARPYNITTTPVPIAALHYNIFGYTLGGPLTIPKVYDGTAHKTFFFAGGEWRINHYPASIQTRNMIPQSMRNGDFSKSSDPFLAGNPLTLDASSQNLLKTYRGIDPTTCIKQDSNGVYNQINSACMDTTAVAIMNAYWPVTNSVSTTTINYINNGTEKDVQADYNYRIDHSINEKNQITGRWTNEEVNDLRPSRNYNDPAPNPGSTVYSRGLNALLRLNTVITPNLINTLEGGETFNKWLLGVTNYTMPSGVTIPQMYSNADPFNRIPDISMNGTGTWAWLGVGAQPNFIHDGVTVVSDDVSWLKGNHMLQAGAIALFTIRHVNANSFPMGNYSFSGVHTGDTVADFLLGLDATYAQSNEQPSGRFHNRWMEAYFQDDWKVNPKLTINYGVRYSYYWPTYMEGDQVTNFNASNFVAANAPLMTTGGGYASLNASKQPLTATGTVANLTNGLVYAGQGISRGFDNPKATSFGPRVGFAYRLTNDGKTSLHGGFGIGYTQVAMLETSSLMLNPPFVQSTTLSNTLFSQPTAGAVAGAPGISGLTVIGPDYQPTATKTFSLGVERQVMTNAVAQVAYAGSISQHVMAEGYNYNFAQNGTSANTATCGASASNPLNSTSYPYAGPSVSYSYDPCINSGAVSSLYYAPYQGFSSISGTNNGGIANYNGLQSGFVWKGRSLTLNGAYTWSKSLEDVQPNNPGANGAGVGYDQNASFQNPRNKKGDYGTPDYDRKHVFTSAWVYKMPFFEHSGNIIARELLSGWGSSGLFVVESGLAVTPSLSVGSQGLASRANLIGAVTHPGNGKTQIGGTSAKYWSVGSFQAPAWGMFGNAKPGMLRGPKEVSVSTALDKTFPIHENIGFKLRVEAFNVFNHPNININGTYGGPTSGFGNVAGSGDPRMMEFSGRFTF